MTGQQDRPAAMPSRNELPSLKIGTAWVQVEILSEADVNLTFKGYAPILRVRVVKTGLEYLLYVGPKSLAQPLEELRTRRGGRFLGLRIRIRKTVVRAVC